MTAAARSGPFETRAWAHDQIDILLTGARLDPRLGERLSAIVLADRAFKLWLVMQLGVLFAYLGVIAAAWFVYDYANLSLAASLAAVLLLLHFGIEPATERQKQETLDLYEKAVRG